MPPTQKTFNWQKIVIREAGEDTEVGDVVQSRSKGFLKMEVSKSVGRCGRDRLGEK